jgi:SAM-dependent methyltransferase
MTFDVSGDSYDRFMGRYSRELSPVFADWSGVRSGQDVLDVGCGSGVLTEELARRVGPEHVAGADPSDMLGAAKERVPGADLREGTAEALPWEDDSFDVAASQLVLHFLEDPRAGTLEMSRVVRPGGAVAACTWDIGGGMTFLDRFWDAMIAVVPDAPRERVPFMSEVELADLWRGLEDVETGPLDVEARYEDFDELWGTLQLGVGPAGVFLKQRSPEEQDAVRGELLTRLGDPSGSFALSARAWAVRGRVPG